MSKIKKRRYSTKLKLGTKIKIVLLLLAVASISYYAGGTELNEEPATSEEDALSEMSAYLSDEDTDESSISIETDDEGNIKGLNIKL